MSNSLQKTTTAPAALLTGFIDYLDRSPATARTYAGNLRQFLAYLRYKGIERPTRADIMAFRDYLLQEHEAIIYAPDTAAGWAYRLDHAGRRYTTRCEAATAAQYMCGVRALFRWAAAAGLYDDIAQGLRGPSMSRTHRRAALTAEDVSRIAEAIKTGPGTSEQRQRLLCMFLLSATAGLRTIELHRARLEDLEEIGGRPALWIRGKGRSAADECLPLPPALYSELKRYQEQRTGSRDPGAPLFTATGNRNKGQAIEARTISGQIKAAMRAAGYDSPRLTAHSLRHTAATQALRLSGDLYTVQRYLRHATPATTEIYLHEARQDQLAQLAGAIFESYSSEQAKNREES